ncbi:MAG: hypothetical protein F6K10_43435 [Moorea sp. SIO2B7]|nr:hypothetical protein [Moorena sp. SIO2B7]
MHTYHQIPKWRLEREYLISIARGCGLATCSLKMINAKTWEKPIIFIRTILGNLRRIIIHLSKYRGRVNTDIIAAFEREFFWSSLLSTFWFLKNVIKGKFLAK